MSQPTPAMDGTPTFNEPPISLFACPNPDCADFNRFGAENLSVAERMGKGKTIRRLYCKTCQTRFSERKGSLLEYTKLPEPAVVRMIKCLGHGCSMEAAADICEVDFRTGQRLLEKAGQRAEDFHRLQLEKLDQPLDAVEMDELHTRSTDQEDAEKKRATNLLHRIANRVESGFMRLWR